MEFLTRTQFKLVDKAKYTFVVSALLILAGVVSLIMHGGPHLGIDFTGGTILQVRILPAPELAEVRGLLEEAGFAGVQVQDFGASDELLITFSDVESGELDAAEEMKAVLVEGLSESTVEMRREEAVGPKIGGELKTAAMNSVVAALVLIVLYITVRFVFRYGVAAIIALIHDVTITLGIFSLLDKEITLSIIAAFLTIIGYSLNDTIVVFDRIRENMKLRRRESYREVINRSINETLSRTVVTSLTTLFVAGSLFVLGGAVIHDFAFALCLGVVVGTYSSIFVASPVLVWWNQRYISDPRRQRQAM